MSLQKYAVAAAVAACAVPGVALAQTSTAAPVPVNLNRNIVTIVLIIGVSVVVPLIYVLWKVIPRLRSGELSLSKIEFDWRAELLNKTPKKEKARLAEEKARRAEAMARRAEEMAGGRHDNVDESGMANVPGTQPRVEVRGLDKAEVGVYNDRNARQDADAHVHFSREHRE